MSGNKSEKSDDDEVSTTDAETNATASSNYKVLGSFTDTSGAGVLGKNDAGTGTPIGVKGVVPDGSQGFGLSTPNNANVGGRLEASAVTVSNTLEADTLGTDTIDVPRSFFTIETDDGSGNGGNVFLGHPNNTGATGTIGATVSGGGSSSELNQAAGDYAAIGGGRDNRAQTKYDTTGGGRGNFTEGGSGGTDVGYATTGGGRNNDCQGLYATIGGGRKNNTAGDNATVSGGYHNEAWGKHSTVGGGAPTDFSTETTRDDTANRAYDSYCTVAGGGNNQAGVSGSTDALYATVSGGRKNVAEADYATVGGGTENTATAKYATVPGGDSNEATGQRSLAAGRNAIASNSGCFVWSDGGSTMFESTSPNQFLVEAGAGVGINTTSTPHSGLTVKDFNADTNGVWENHLVGFETTTDNGDVLALRNSGETGDPGTGTNYITFFDDSTSNTLGAIQGDGNGSVTLAGAGSDYAEWLPRRDPEEAINPGDVVGVHRGEISLDTDGADEVMVVSTQPIVTGNDPGPDQAARQSHEKIAFVGQVPVRIRESVTAGDIVVASGEHDGTARAIDPAAFAPDDGPVVGRAWEGSEDDGISEVTVAVGTESGDALSAAQGRQQETIDDQAARIDALEAENDQLCERNNRLEERLATLEERVANMNGGGASTASADD